MKKLKAILALFRAGQVVADPAKWKKRQVGVTALAGFLGALIQLVAMFGVAIPVPPGITESVALAIVTVVNIVLTYTTSDKVGVGKGDK